MTAMHIKCIAAAVWLLAGVWCASAPAHHSIAATYIASERIRIEGVVVKFQFRNPHSFIHVMAPDPRGAVQRWAVECAGTARLVRNNVSPRTLKPGDRVIIIGNPGRNPADHRILMHSIEHPAGGWKWSS